MIPALQSNPSMSLSAVRYNPDDSVTVALTFPSDFLPDFSGLISSADKFIHQLRLKVRIARAEARAIDPDMIYQRKLAYDRFTADILSKYDKYILSGMQHRAAVNAVKQKCLKAGDYMTCYTIECIVRESGRLSKRKYKQAH